MGVFVVAHAPFRFVYTSSLTNRDFKANFKNLYHFGFILLFITSLIPYFALSYDKQMALVLEKYGRALGEDNTNIETHIQAQLIGPGI